MRAVSIIGIGSTTFGKHPNCSPIRLAVEASQAALKDSNVKPYQVDAFYLGNALAEILNKQGGLAGMVAHEVGLRSIPCTRVEGACASAGIALRHGYLAVAHGIVDIVLVAGVEKMTGVPTSLVTAALSCYADRERDALSGLTFPGFFGLVARRYMHRYGADQEQMAAVAVKNRTHGHGNPRAYFRDPIQVEDVLQSRVICDPLHLYDCSPISDGATAAVLCPQDWASSFNNEPINILASVQTSGPTHIGAINDLTSFPATVNAAQKAYEEARRSPQEIDVVELHDCFTIAEIIDSEDLGFFPKGEGGIAAQEGKTGLQGQIPINPSGGLMSRGHPVGATGLAQIFELTQQLRGTAANQISGAEIGLAHNLGGTGAVATVTILGKA